MEQPSIKADLETYAVLGDIESEYLSKNKISCWAGAQKRREEQRA